jgi:hypothetical protein
VMIPLICVQSMQSSTISSEIWPCMLRKLEMGSECLGVSPCQCSACGARESWRRARALPRAAVVVFCKFSALMQRSGSVLYLQTAAVETEEQNHSDGLKFELLSARFNFTSISPNRASSGLIWDKKNLFFPARRHASVLHIICIQTETGSCN